MTRLDRSEKDPARAGLLDDEPRGFARWWRAALDIALAVFCFGWVVFDGLPAFIIGVGFALSAVDEVIRALRGRFFASPRDQVRYALLSIPFNALLVGSVIAWVLDASDRTAWTVAGVLIAISGAAAAHYTATHALTNIRPSLDAREGDD